MNKKGLVISMTSLTREHLRRHDVGVSLSGPLLAKLDAASAFADVADAVLVAVRGSLQAEIDC